MNIYNYDDNNNDPSKYNDVISKLQDYMLTENNIKKYLQEKNLKNDNIKISIVKDDIVKNNIVKNIKNTNDNNKSDILKQNTTPPENQISFPRENDSLFWCLYVMINGDVSYETFHNKTVVSEKQIKIEYIEKIRKQKDIIKMYKIATITHIENNLANENKLDIKTFLTLCVTNNLNVVVVVKRTYYEILMNDSDTIFLIHVKNGHRYGYENNAKEKIETIRKTFLKIENNNKPLKAISGYKVSELIELCNKLDIKICDNETGKSKSKQNLYESIVQYFHFH